jgi:DNA-binding response OmpR family regulator
VAAETPEGEAILACTLRVPHYDPAVTSASPDSATILVVDDEPSILRLFQRVLEKPGHNVLTASDADEGLTLFRENAGRIDLVILDVMIPPNGVASLLDGILETKSETVVVLVSGDLLSPELQARLAGCGGHFFRKPFMPKQLLALVPQARAVLSNNEVG